MKVLAETGSYLNEPVDETIRSPLIFVLMGKLLEAPVNSVMPFSILKLFTVNDATPPKVITWFAVEFHISIGTANTDA